ncbi:MAG: hypothetical protein ACI8QI_001331, partial [Limisphaerales bacterium]
MFLRAQPPTREQREREYDPFSIDGKRFDVWSFPQATPFSATFLGHHWSDIKDAGDCPVVGRLEPGFYLVNTGDEDSNIIRDWGVRLPEIDGRDYQEYHFYEQQFDKGDFSNELNLRDRLEKGEGCSSWMVNLFVRKAWQLLKPVVCSAESGNPSAIKAISFLTHRLTSSLERITRSNVEEVRKISTNRFCWPALHSPHPELKTEQQDSYIANLRVGSKLPVRVERARWSDSPLSMLVLELIEFVYRLRADREMDTIGDPLGDYSPQSELGEVCQSLPELTKETAKSHWWPVVREI